MTDTPETDANQIFLGLNPDEGDYFVPAEIARQLEQQRDGLAEELHALKRSILDLSHPNMKLLLEERDTAVNNYETAVLREHRMEEQRDTYKAACDKYSEDETINTLCSLKEQRDEAVELYNAAVIGAKLIDKDLKKAEETAERYRLDANRLEAEVMMLKEKLKEYDDTLTVCTGNFSSKTFVPQKWELPPYDEHGKGTPIE